MCANDLEETLGENLVEEESCQNGVFIRSMQVDDKNLESVCLYKVADVVEMATSVAEKKKRSNWESYLSNLKSTSTFHPVQLKYGIINQIDETKKLPIMLSVRGCGATSVLNILKIEWEKSTGDIKWVANIVDFLTNENFFNGIENGDKGGIVNKFIELLPKDDNNDNVLFLLDNLDRGIIKYCKARDCLHEAYTIRKTVLEAINELCSNSILGKRIYWLVTLLGKAPTKKPISLINHMSAMVRKPRVSEEESAKEEERVRFFCRHVSARAVEACINDVNEARDCQCDNLRKNCVGRIEIVREENRIKPVRDDIDKCLKYWIEISEKNPSAVIFSFGHIKNFADVQKASICALKSKKLMKKYVAPYYREGLYEKRNRGNPLIEDYLELLPLFILSKNKLKHKDILTIQETVKNLFCSSPKRETTRQKWENIIQKVLKNSLGKEIDASELVEGLVGINFLCMGDSLRLHWNKFLQTIYEFK